MTRPAPLGAIGDGYGIACLASAGSGRGRRGVGRGQEKIGAGLRFGDHGVVAGGKSNIAPSM